MTVNSFQTKFQDTDFQVSYLDESGTAGVAVVGLFSRVDAGVGLQVGGPVELGPAYVAAIRLVTCRGHSRPCYSCLKTSLPSSTSLLLCLSMLC